MAESSAPAVALLFDASEGGASTREAVTASGAHIVYEAATQGFDRDELARAQVDVVVIDLHGPDESEFDRLDTLAEEYRVIFNDAEVSSALSGWDRARWQRHLGAKICGGEVDPPRPLDAEPVPTRPMTGAQDAGAAEPPPPSMPVQEVAADPAPEVIDPVVENPPEPIFSPQGAAAAELAGIGEIDIDLPPVPDWADAPEFPATDTPVADTAAALAGAHESAADAPELDAWVQAALDGDAQPQEAAPPAVDAPFAAPAEHVPATAGAPPPAPADHESWGLLDLDTLPDAPAATAPGLEDATPDTSPDVLAADPEPPADGIAAPEWTLDEPLADAPEPPPVASPSEFGIETVTAAEFLAPEGAEDLPVPMETPPSFEFELIPLEEAVAPRQVSDSVVEHRLEALDSAAVRVRRVWVLGASVGGPEAVREFLAALPRDYPALFVLAQHLGGEFLDIMARQLAQATPLQVRTPEHGDRVGHGDVVVVPQGKRLQVDLTGAIVLREESAEVAYSPSIDTLLCDVADRFGAAAGAIIFSGIGRDAIEGSRYLAGKGGQVWLQQPETCVVASMVEGVRDTGVASFTGSPGELARHLRDNTP